MSLSVSHLSCRRSGRLVLAPLDFEVAPGAALILRGPNGAGKSTLLRVLAGLLPVSGGSARLDGIGLGANADAWVERIAYTGHLDAIKPQLSVAENLRFWAAVFGAGRDAVDRALDAFAMSALADRPAHACSAGQKRRLGLARLLLAPRRLWLLDEPTVSLDAESVARFAGLIRAHGAEGGMALIATHADLGVAGAELRLVPAVEGAGDGSADPFLAGSYG